ncbi:MAG: glycosyltransferase family 4 protein [Agarilytica sp.]
MSAAEENIQQDILAQAHSSQRNARALNIALLGYRSAPFVGGQGIYLKYLSKALVDLGHSVDVYSGPPYPELDSDVRLIKVPSLDLFAQESHVRALRPKHLLSYTDFIEWWSMLSGGFAEPYTFGRRVEKLLGHHNYDIIHDNQSLCFGLLKLQAQGKKVVSTIHHPIHRDLETALASAPSWGDKLLVKRWYSFLRMQNKVAKKLKHVVTVSKASQNDIEKYFTLSKTQTQVVPNGIDTEVFTPLSEVERIPYRIITTASSDQPIKGLNILLDAFSKLKNRYPQAHIRIIGKFKKDGHNQQRLHELGLVDHVSFVSGISTQELVKEYAQASVMVCPSLYEGFGLPLGEAMACEVPAISSDGGALPEVAGKAAHVVPAGSSDALAEKLKTVFDNSNDALNLGKQGRQHILEHFSWKRVAEQLTQYYLSILRTH